MSEAPELHVGHAATPAAFKAWVVGLSPYTPSVGHWDEVETFGTRAKALAWAERLVRTVRERASAAGVVVRVRTWMDGQEQQT
jgi:hypothetical protein